MLLQFKHMEVSCGTVFTFTERETSQKFVDNKKKIQEGSGPAFETETQPAPERCF